MQSNKTCPIIEQYLSYLFVIKGRSENTVLEYRTDLLMFFKFVLDARKVSIADGNFKIVDLEFIKSITLSDMYGFIAHCQSILKASAGTRARKIVSI
jgi:site-specific recombinase XerD